MSTFFAQFKLVFYLAGVAALLSAFWYVYHIGQTNQSNIDKLSLDKAVSQYQVQINTEQARRQEIATLIDQKLSNIQVVNTTVNRNFKTELHTNTVYTTCVVPTTGVDLINSTVIQLNNSRNQVTK